MDSLSEIEKRILEIKETIITEKAKIRTQAIPQEFIDGQIAKLECSYEDELEILETKRKFLIDRGVTEPSSPAKDTEDPTIFYAWQSDLPGNLNHFLIRDALQDAILAVRSDISIVDDPRLDESTAGIPGSPDIQATIFSKISNATMFVCDVSIVTPKNAARPMPNPNILIELGYAIRVLGWENIILAMNLNYGEPEDLPFDIRGRRVLRYACSEQEVGGKGSVKKALTKQLQEAISLSLSHKIEAPTPEFFVASFDSFKSYPSIRIYNTSNEVIEEMKVDISWLDAGIEQTRNLKEFYDESQNPVLESPTGRAFIKPGQEIITTSPPHYSDNGEIRLHIEGKGNPSKKAIRFDKTLQNQLRHLT